MAPTPIQKKTAKNNNIRWSSCNCEIIFWFNWGLRRDEPFQDLRGAIRPNSADLQPALVLILAPACAPEWTALLSRLRTRWRKPLQPHHKTSDVTRSPDIKKARSAEQSRRRPGSCGGDLEDGQAAPQVSAQEPAAQGMPGWAPRNLPPDGEYWCGKDVKNLKKKKVKTQKVQPGGYCEY